MPRLSSVSSKQLAGSGRTPALKYSVYDSNLKNVFYSLNTSIVCKVTKVAGYGNNWVAVGGVTISANNRIRPIAYSNDNGVTWAAGDLQVSLNQYESLWYGVATNGIQWITVGGNTAPYAAISYNNGTTWSTSTISSDIYTALGNSVPHDICWNGEYYFVVGSNANVIKSNDGGYSWSSAGTLTGMSPYNNFQIDSYGTTIVAARANTGKFAVSTNNGSSWNLYSPTGNTFANYTFSYDKNNKIGVMAGNGNNRVSVTTGTFTSFSTVILPYGNGWLYDGNIFTGKHFILGVSNSLNQVGGDYFSSRNGINWQTMSNIPSFCFGGIGKNVTTGDHLICNFNTNGSLSTSTIRISGASTPVVVPAGPKISLGSYGPSDGIRIKQNEYSSYSGSLPGTSNSYTFIAKNSAGDTIGTYTPAVAVTLVFVNPNSYYESGYGPYAFLGAFMAPAEWNAGAGLKSLAETKGATSIEIQWGGMSSPFVIYLNEADPNAVYYYTSSTEYTISNPNTLWQFARNTTNTFNNTVSAVVPGPEAALVYLTDTGDPVSFALPTPISATGGVTFEWWQYTPTYGGSQERVSTFGLCELDPKNVWLTGSYKIGSRIWGITYNNTYAGVWGHGGPTEYSISTIGGGGVTTNQWNHYAVVYSDAGYGVTTLYINGNQIGSVTGTQAEHVPTTFNYVQILNANFSNVSNSVNNNILVSSFRVSSGQRYTSGGFTPSQNLTRDGTTVFFTKFSQV